MSRPTEQYERSRSKAIENYAKLGFKKERVEAYKRAWEYMPEHYRRVFEPQTSKTKKHSEVQ